MFKKIYNQKEGLSLIREGIKELAETVTNTYGVAGHTVVLDNEYSTPLITKDGVTVAHNIFFKDRMKNIGAKFLQEVAYKTNVAVGDGTTTSVILAHSIFENVYNEIINDKISNIHTFKKGMDSAVNDIIKELNNFSKKIETKEKIKDVATISANNDSKIGLIIADVVDKIGSDGVIIVEESKGVDIITEYIDGLQIDKGYISHYFINKPESLTCEYEDVYVIVSKDTVDYEYIHLINKIIKQEKPKPFLIIAPDFTLNFTTLVTQYVAKKQCFGLLVKFPYIGANYVDEMEDLAIYCGAKLLNNDINDIEKYDVNECCGKIEKVIANRDHTTILGGFFNETLYTQRVHLLKNQIEKETESHAKHKLMLRLAKLTNGLASIKVGANTETELKELKHRVEDAVNATKSALKSGVVCGGGFALYKIEKKIYPQFEKFSIIEAHDFNNGYKNILKSIRQPLEIMVQNTYQEEKNQFDYTKYTNLDDIGVNFKTREDVDLFESGIIDSVEVICTGLKYANSVIGTLITTSNYVINEDLA